MLRPSPPAAPDLLHEAARVLLEYHRRERDRRLRLALWRLGQGVHAPAVPMDAPPGRE